MIGGLVVGIASCHGSASRPSAQPAAETRVFAALTASCTNAADGAPCEDGDLCTQGDTCRAGACTSGAPVSCAQDVCHPTAACQPTTGACSAPYVHGPSCPYLPFSLFDPPGTDETQAVDINDAGTAIGWANAGVAWPGPGNYADTAFTASATTVQAIASPPGWPSFFPNQINAAGFVTAVGGPSTTDWLHGAIVRPDGSLHVLPIPAPSFNWPVAMTEALGANDLPTVVGAIGLENGGALSIWHLDGDTRDTSTFVGGNAQLPEPPSPHYVGGHLGQALQFDGATTLLQGNTFGPGTGGFGLSISAWIKPSGPCPATPAWILQRGSYYSFGLACGPGGATALTGTIGLSGAPPPLLGPVGSLTVDDWNHVAMVWNESVVRFYVNGALAGEVPAAGTLVGYTETLTMGAGLVGALDEVVLFQTPLSPVEIAHLRADDTAAAYQSYRGWTWMRYADGEVQLLSPLAGAGFSVSVSASSINERGEAVGSSSLSEGAQDHAILVTDRDGMRDLNDLLPANSGWVLTAATRINEARQIIGRGEHAGEHRMFRFDLGAGRIKDLGVLPTRAGAGLYRFADDVNQNGFVVGASYDNGPALAQLALVYTDAVGLTDLNTLVDPSSGWTLVEAKAINDSDEIVGVAYSDTLSQWRGFRMQLGAEAVGGCLGQADGTPCDDANACTNGDTCRGGACVPGTAVTCPAPVDRCHAQGVCDPGTGVCSMPLAPDGTSCDDGSACTRADVCQAGACMGTDPVICPVPDACHAPGVCDAATGTCSNPPLTTGTCQLGAFDYDHAGRLIRDRGAELVYDGYDQLREVHPRPAPPPPFANLPVEDLGNIGGDIAFGNDANASGAVVGEARDAGTGFFHAFVSSRPGPFVDLRALTGLTGDMFGSAINDAGTVAGTFTTAGQKHAYRYSAARGLEDLGVLGSTNDNSTVIDINDAGQVAGYTTVGSTEFHGFLYSDGRGFQDVGTLGGMSSMAFFVDEIGNVYGTAQTPTSPPIGASTDPAQFGHAFIFNDEVGVLDLNNFVDPALGITLIFPGRPAGDWLPVTGTVGSDPTERAFLVRLSTHTVIPIDGLPGEMTALTANSFGDVVGFGSKVAGSTASADRTVWFRNDQLGFIDLNTAIDPASGWQLTHPAAITDAGDVVGWGIHNGQISPFRLRLPLRTITGGPTIAEVHTYGYDGLRTTTTTAPGAPTAKVQFWFTQDYTEHDGTREHYLRRGDRIVAKLTFAPPAVAATAVAGTLRDIRHPPRDTGDLVAKVLIAVLVGAGLLASGAGVMGKKRRPVWVTATAGPVMLFFVASCETLGSNRDSALTVWQRISTTYFHSGVAVGPVLTTDQVGALVEERRYEPFGQPIDASVRGSVGPVDFRREQQNSLGKLTDATTGWSYHGARWMQPQAARWTAPDPVVKAPAGQLLEAPWALNPYAYVTQNPMLYWDPQGLAGVPEGDPPPSIGEEDIGDPPPSIGEEDIGDPPLSIPGETSSKSTQADHIALTHTPEEGGEKKDGWERLIDIMDHLDKATQAGEAWHHFYEHKAARVLGTMQVQPYVLKLSNGIELGPFSDGKPQRKILPRGMAGEGRAPGLASYKPTKLVTVGKILGFAGGAWFIIGGALRGGEIANARLRHDRPDELGKEIGAVFYIAGYVAGSNEVGFFLDFASDVFSDIGNPAYRNVPICRNPCHGL